MSASVHATTLLANIDVMPDVASGGAAAYGVAFLAGVAVDLTPCVFPLIPITVSVFGAKGVSRGKALALASAYVLGMAALYTVLGVVVAYTGGQFGTWLANPWVVLPISGILLALAASMFGAFDLQLPTSMQSKLNSVGGAGYMGAFLMGLVAAFISAPCSGPVLVSILTYIAAASAETSGGSAVFFGGSLLFVYALGMGSLFFAVAAGASLFRPGAWMEYVKSVFGVMLVVMALYFCRPLWPWLEDFILHPSWGMWIGITLVLAGLGLGAVHLSFHASRSEQMRKAVAVGIAVIGSIVAVNNLAYVPPGDFHEVETRDALAQELKAAEEAGKPVLIDFAATWCIPCKEMEKLTFHDEEVERVITRQFHLIKFDVTEGEDDQIAMQAAFEAKELPSVVIYSSGTKLAEALEGLEDGGRMPEPTVRFSTMTGAAEFLAGIEGVQ